MIKRQLEVVEILMKRDGLTKDEAVKEVQDTQIAVEDALVIGDSDAVEDIIADYLGLEPDYIDAFLVF